MNKENEENESSNNIKIFGQILPSLPVLMIKYGGLFLRIKSDATKAGKIFQKELIKNGINETTANNLTSMYLEASNIANYFKLFRNI